MGQVVKTHAVIAASNRSGTIIKAALGHGTCSARAIPGVVAIIAVLSVSAMGHMGSKKNSLIRPPAIKMGLAAIHMTLNRLTITDGTRLAWIVRAMASTTREKNGMIATPAIGIKSHVLATSSTARGNTGTMIKYRTDVAMVMTIRLAA